MANVGLEIPENLIADVIHGEIARVLASRTDLVEATVKAMLQQKASSYDRETIFAKNLSSAVNSVAQEVLGEWVESRKEEIRAALHKTLAQKGTMGRLADSLVDQMCRWSVSLHLSLDEE